MSVVPHAHPASAALEPPPLTAAQADAACAGPVLVLAAKALGWLVIGLFLLTLAAMKVHAPGAFDYCAALSYGRLQPAAWNAIVFGFVAQSGLALTLWLCARLGRAPVNGGGFVWAATGVWNFVVLAGVIAILCGYSTGIARFEMPFALAPILFAAYAVIGVVVLLTLHARRERTLYVSIWFALAALFIFPWLLSTAWVALSLSPVRGAAQLAVQTWYANGLSTLWMTSLGLAALFYFLPKFSGQPLPSRTLAVFGFWAWLLFGGLTGFAPGTPLPRWFNGLSVVAGVFLLTALLAIAMNLLHTGLGANAAPADRAARRFLAFGFACFVIAQTLSVLKDFPALSRLVRFTAFETGIQQLQLLGFVAMTLNGALYQILPRILRAEPVSAGVARWHFMLAALGVAVSSVALLTGGWTEGHAALQPARTQLEVILGTLPFLGLNTLGLLLLTLGQSLQAVALVRFALRWATANLLPIWRGWTTPVTAEVKP